MLRSLISRISAVCHHLGFPAIAGKITHLDRSAIGFGSHHLIHTDHLSILQDGSYTNNTFAFSIFTVNPAALIMMAACVDWFSQRPRRRFLNFIRKLNKCKEEYGRKNDTVAVGQGTR